MARVQRYLKTTKGLKLSSELGQKLKRQSLKSKGVFGGDIQPAFLAYLLPQP